MLYELRIYHVAPGRRKDLEGLFENTNIPNFKKHGMELIDLWFSVDERENLYYILGFEDKNDREKKWAAFQADPSFGAAIKDLGQPVLEVESYLMERLPFVSKK